MSQSQSLFRSYGSILPTSLTYIRLYPEAVHLGDLMRSSVRSGTGVLCHSLGFSRSVRLSKDPAESTGLWRYFSTRPCPWLRTERFVGSVGRQPEQITLPLDRRSASPSLVALQRAIFQSQGTSTMPPSVTQRETVGATRVRVTESLRYPLSPKVRAAPQLCRRREPRNSPSA